MLQNLAANAAMLPLGRSKPDPRPTEDFPEPVREIHASSVCVVRSILLGANGIQTFRFEQVSDYVQIYNAGTGTDLLKASFSASAVGGDNFVYVSAGRSLRLLVMNSNSITVTNTGVTAIPVSIVLHDKDSRVGME